MGSALVSRASVLVLGVRRLLRRGFRRLDDPAKAWRKDEWCLIQWNEWADDGCGDTRYLAGSALLLFRWMEYDVMRLR